jgi:hypothetical protein
MELAGVEGHTLHLGEATVWASQQGVEDDGIHGRIERCIFWAVTPIAAIGAALK